MLGKNNYTGILTHLWCFCNSWLNIVSSDSPVRVTSWRVMSSWKIDSLNCVANIARCCLISSTLATKCCISLTEESSSLEAKWPIQNKNILAKISTLSETNWTGKPFLYLTTEEYQLRKVMYFCYACCKISLSFADCYKHTQLWPASHPAKVQEEREVIQHEMSCSPCPLPSSHPVLL